MSKKIKVSRWFLLLTAILLIELSMVAWINAKQADKYLKQRQEISQPVLIYKVDNWGADLVGTVTDKENVHGYHTVTVDNYGKFLVTKEQYNIIEIGDDISKIWE